MPRALLIVAVSLAVMFGRSEAQTCPPKHYACWQVRAAAATYGIVALEALARACGWSEEQIALARRCLK